MSKYLQVDPVLTNAAIAFSNPMLIAEQVFPTVRVAKESGKHYIYDRGRFRVTDTDDTKRGTGANSKEIELSLTTGYPYMCEDHAVKHFVADEDMANATAPQDPMNDAAEFTMDTLKIHREKELADILTNTAILTQNVTLSGTDQWNDYTNSDPIDDIQTGVQTIQSAVGVQPNLVIIGQEVWNKLKHHPALLERIKYSQTGVVTPDLFASMFDGNMRVLIAGGYYVSSDEGQTETTGYVWGKNVVLGYVADRVAPKIMTLGINYEWAGESLQVARLRGSDEEDRKGTYVRAGDWYYDQNVVAAGAGYLIKNAVA